MKSDHQIVQEVNALAAKLLLNMGTGFVAPDGFKFYAAPKDNVRATRAWEQAVEIYESITASEVHDAVQAVLEDEEKDKEDPLANHLRVIAGTTLHATVEGSPRSRERDAVLAAADRVDALSVLVRKATTYDDELDDKANDGAQARPPDGDDYNALLDLIAAAAFVCAPACTNANVSQ